MHKSLLRNQQQEHTLALKIILAVALCTACICASIAMISAKQTTEMIGTFKAPFPIMRGQLLWNLDTGIAVISLSIIYNNLCLLT